MQIDVAEYYKKYGPMVLRRCRSMLGDEDKAIADSCEVLKTRKLFNTNEMDLIQVSMKYACKMVGMSSFRGNYARPYWIVYRINKYASETTSKEYEIFLKVVEDHMGWGKNKKTIPILSEKEFHQKLMDIVKHLGLQKEYKKWERENKDKVGFRRLSVNKVRNMVQDYYSSH